MKISILGCNGFLSSAIGKYAEQRNCYLVMYGRTEPSSHGYDKYVKCDLADIGSIIIDLLDSDIVVYAAGAGIQADLKESASVIYNLNVWAPISLCNGLRERGFKGRLVTFGSYFEMGETQEKRMFTETDILSSNCKAPSDYIVSKRLFSRFVDSYSHDFTHWHFILPTIYGPGENSMRLIPYTIDAMINKKPLLLTDGYQTRQYLYVEEVAKVLELSINKKLPSGIYNIQGNDTLSVRDLVALICQSLGVDIPIGYFGSKKRSDTVMSYLALDGNKLYSALGFKAGVVLSDVLNNYY